MEHWKILHSQNVFDHHWYTLRQDCVQLPDGNVVDDYFVSVRRDVVIICAVTLDEMVPLVRQYKHGAQKVVLELPGGFVDDGEAPQEAAARELLEETGYAARDFFLLSQVHDNPTKDTNSINLYLATHAEKQQEQSLDQNERISVESVPLHQLASLVFQGEINVCGSIATIFLALERMKRLTINL